MKQAVLEAQAQIAIYTKEAAPFWTTAKLCQWIKEHFEIFVGKETIRRTLKRLGFSWKKARKLLNRADPQARADFLEKLEALVQSAIDDKTLLVYIDESHIHPDATVGYGWGVKSERLWVSSNSKCLAEKTSLYGVYYYNYGQVRVWDFPTANQDHTKVVLEKIREDFPSKRIEVIWDGASYHRAKEVYRKAASLNIHITQLPAYSPDFMPVEELWAWIKKEITDHHAFEVIEDSVRAIIKFIEAINQNPFQIADRLHRKNLIDDQIEKLRFSG